MDIDRNKLYLDMLNQWLIIKQEGRSVGSYIEKCGWQSVAIYGMGIYGRHIIRELKGTKCRILYGIDRQKIDVYEGIKILNPAERLPEVDIVINSVIHEQDDIAKHLKTIISCPVVSLEEIVYASY